MGQSSDVNELLALYQELEGRAEPPQERRAHPRTAAKGHVPAAVEIEGGVPIEVLVRDMSRSGIGVYATNPMGVGGRVVVSFRLQGGVVRARCRVVNCREDEGGRYVVGMAFEEVSRSEGAGVPEGTIVSGMEAVAGADLTHVDDVVRRLGRAIHRSI